ncbi:cob(I)yrinic acid a,c-diamide adenosyltransferase, partial [Pseudomonas aeruginosa]|nr:cob(I)yrinic acid a,c-diamide adenosyltransferase [Pseudomonas aeruginosa]
MNESPEKDQRHRERMERKKAVIDEKIAQARDERGVLLV